MASSEGVALIYAPEGVDPRAIFAGRPLIDRAIALAETAGLTPYVVGAADAPCPSGVDRVAPGGRLPVDLLPRTNVVLWRCDVAWVARTLQAVLRDGSGTRTVALDDRGRPAVVRLTATRLAGRVPATLELAAGGATAIGAPGQVAGNRLIALDAGGAGRFRAAEAELVATLDNPRDGVFDRVFNRPISRRVTPFLLSWPITPNQVTVLSLAVGLLAAVALAQSGYLWPIAGALLLQLTAVLDCVDGEIARAKVLESEWGELLDITTDSVIHVVVFLGMAAHAWPALGVDVAWALGALFATGGFASFVVVTRAERSEERWRPIDDWQARLLARMLATLTTRDLSVLVLAAAASGMLTQLLVGASFGAHAFWVSALALHTSLMRRAAGPPGPARVAAPTAERRARS
ncbi:MAG TPA: CDP-alcohol phosphatidyltransferase family protein [Candidatus Binatia bacterium]|nr:CDP-alcohol phosphatidyltransferase family protein [Candidatus Binatia bacterium]